MVIDAIRMNYDYSSKASCNISLDEEPNIDIVKFFELLKVLMNNYEMSAQFTIICWPLTKCLPSSQIKGWVRSVMIRSLNG